MLGHMFWNGSIVAYSVLTERGLIAIDELFVALPLTAVFLALLWWAVANRRAPA